MSIPQKAIKHWPLALLLLAIGYVYAGIIDGPFVFDDHNAIVQNRAIQIEQFDTQALAQIASESYLPTRFFANLTFALNYLTSGLETRSYHTVNIVIHALNAILVYLFLGQLLRSRPELVKAHVLRWLPLLAAALWALHPIQTQAVSYVVQRMAELAFFFYLLSLVLYLAARRANTKRPRGALLSLAVLSGLLALLNKENAATLPLAILLVEWFFLQQADWQWLKKRFWVLLGAAAILLFAGLIYTGGNLVGHVLDGYQGRSFDLQERLLTQPRVILHYLYLWFVPLPGNFVLDYDFRLSTGLLSPLTTLPAVLFILVAVGLALRYAARFPLPALSVLWLFLSQTIESSIIPLEIIFEHRMYLPSVGVALLCALAILSIPYRHASAAIVLLVLPALASSTQARNQVWTDTLLLWQDSATKSPSSPRALAQLGKVLMDRGRWSEAVSALKKALALDPGNYKIHLNLAAVYANMSEPDLAEKHLLEARTIRPDSIAVLYNLSHFARQKDRWRESKAYLQQILDADPKQPLAHDLMALTYERWHNNTKTRYHYEQAIAALPGRPHSYLLYGSYLARQGKHHEAIALYEQALARVRHFPAERERMKAELARLRKAISRK